MWLKASVMSCGGVEVFVVMFKCVAMCLKVCVMC